MAPGSPKKYQALNPQHFCRRSRKLGIRRSRPPGRVAKASAAWRDPTQKPGQRLAGEGRACWGSLGAEGPQAGRPTRVHCSLHAWTFPRERGRRSRALPLLLTLPGPLPRATKPPGPCRFRLWEGEPGGGDRGEDRSGLCRGPICWHRGPCPRPATWPPRGPHPVPWNPGRWVPATRGALPAHEGPLRSPPSPAGRKAAQFPGRPWGGSGRGPGRRLLGAGCSPARGAETRRNEML